MPIQKGMLESCRLNGMLWLTEMDRRPQGIREEAVDVGDPALLHETIALMQRSVFQPILAGQGFGITIIRIMPRGPMKITVAAGFSGKRAGGITRPPCRRLPDCSVYLRHSARNSIRPGRTRCWCILPFLIYAKDAHNQYKILEGVARAGVVYDTIYVDDLDKAELDRYCCVIFPEALFLSGEHRAMICRCLKEKPAMYLYAGCEYMFIQGRGGLSSLYMWNVMGIFPASGQNLMYIGTLRLKKTVMHLMNGKDFIVRREGTGIYVKKALLNGRALSSTAFAVTDMMQGGELVLEMTETPC